MERYKEYKDSGVKWLGEIPSHWEIFRNKDIFHERKYAVGKNSGNYTLLSLTKRGVIIRNMDDGGKFPTEFDTYKVVEPGDFVFCFFDVDETPRAVGLSSEYGMITGAYTVLRQSIANSQYLYYYYLSIDEAKALKPLYTGLRKTVPLNAFMSMQIYLPPRAEQDAIVRYLDSATSEIDKAIAMQQKMIDLLNERKQIIIQNAVTKGLDENVEMKESGVEWIGSIPKHWSLIKIKHIAKLQSGSNLTSNDITEIGLYPVYGGNGQRGYYKFYNCEGLYILIGRQGALCGNINYADGKFWATEHAVVCYPKKRYNTLWLGETLRLMNLGQYSLASAQPGLAVERINGLYLPYPTLEEQNKIALFLKSKIDKIDLYTKHCQRQITLLQERKQIIINEVVTGKVRVS